MSTGIYHRKPLTEEHKQNISLKLKGRIPKFIPTNFGKKMAEEQKLKISKKLLGRKLPNEVKRKISLNNPKYNLGKKFSEEYRKKLSDSHKGNKQSEETKIKIGLANKGKKRTLESRKKISDSHKGSKYYGWIKDRNLVKMNTENRRSHEYVSWRRDVCNRDNWKCKLKNNDCLGRIEVHHIFSYTDYPELRFIINNGITLCTFHHPRRWEEEKRMIPIFQELLSVSKE